MEGVAEYESLKLHAAWQCKLRLTVQYIKISRHIYHMDVTHLPFY